MNLLKSTCTIYTKFQRCWFWALSWFKVLLPFSPATPDGPGTPSLPASPPGVAGVLVCHILCLVIDPFMDAAILDGGVWTHIGYCSFSDGLRCDWPLWQIFGSRNAPIGSSGATACRSAYCAPFPSVFFIIMMARPGPGWAR